VALFASSIDIDLVPAIQTVARFLPCGTCRGAEKAARELRSLRLGKHERRALLEAAATDAKDSAFIAPLDSSRAASESLRRAIRRLHGAGLVELDKKKIEGTRPATEQRWFRNPSRWRSAARLSPLGSALVCRYRRDLESGQRIRWSRHAASSLASVRQHPDVNLERFIENVRRHLEVISFYSVAFDIVDARRTRNIRAARERIAARTQQKHMMTAVLAAAGGSEG
jgi:hypothetical protein